FAPVGACHWARRRRDPMDGLWRGRLHRARSRLPEWAGRRRERGRLREAERGGRALHASPLPAGGKREQRRSSGHASLCPPCAAALVLAAIHAAATTAAFAQAPGRPTDGEILALMKTHCVACHAAEPTH